MAADAGAKLVFLDAAVARTIEPVASRIAAKRIALDASFVVLAPGSETSADQVRDWVNARVNKIQHLAAVELLGQLPRSAIGKLLKRELRKRMASGGNGVALFPEQTQTGIGNLRVVGGAPPAFDLGERLVDSEPRAVRPVR